jgi:hypothetical protein
MLQLLLLQLGAHTLFAAQSLLTLAAQQLPAAVDTQLPGAPVPLGHSLVLAGQEQVPPAMLQVSPEMFLMRRQSELAQQRLLAMQVLLPEQA